MLQNTASAGNKAPVTLVFNSRPGDAGEHFQLPGSPELRSQVEAGVSRMHHLNHLSDISFIFDGENYKADFVFSRDGSCELKIDTKGNIRLIDSWVLKFTSTGVFIGGTHNASFIQGEDVDIALSLAMAAIDSKTESYNQLIGNTNEPRDGVRVMIYKALTALAAHARRSIKPHRAVPDPHPTTQASALERAGNSWGSANSM